MLKIWMKVTCDELSLPLAVADTSSELAKMCGTTPNTVVSTWSHYRKGRIKHPSFICVDVERDYDDRFEKDS